MTQDHTEATERKVKKFQSKNRLSGVAIWITEMGEGRELSSIAPGKPIALCTRMGRWREDILEM
jgi:hypothetical protein